MPVSYAIDKQKKLVVTCAWGTCTAEDALEFRRQILKDGDFDPSLNQLADFSGITTLDVTPAEVRMLAGGNIFSPDSRRAIVVEGQLAFALARMFETLRGLRGDRHVRVFHTREEAVAWIFVKDKAA
jgi:hypothetical protein